MRGALLSALLLVVAVVGGADALGLPSDAFSPTPPDLGERYWIRMNNSLGSFTLEYYDYGSQMQRFDTSTIAPPPMWNGDPHPPSNVDVALHRFDMSTSYFYNANGCRTAPLPTAMQPPNVLQNGTFLGVSLTNTSMGAVLTNGWYIDYDGPAPYDFYTETLPPHDPVRLVQGNVSLDYYDYVTGPQPKGVFDVPSWCTDGWQR